MDTHKLSVVSLPSIDCALVADDVMVDAACTDVESAFGGSVVEGHESAVGVVESDNRFLAEQWDSEDLLADAVRTLAVAQCMLDASDVVIDRRAWQCATAGDAVQLLGCTLDLVVCDLNSQCVVIHSSLRAKKKPRCRSTEAVGS